MLSYYLPALLDSFAVSDRYDAAVLVGEEGALQFYEEVVVGRDPKVVANWICNDLFGLLKSDENSSSSSTTTTISSSPITTSRLGGLIDLITEGVISVRTAKELLAVMMKEEEEDGGDDPREMVTKRGWEMISDRQVLMDVCSKVVADPTSSRQLKQYREGKKRMKQYFVGQAMKETQGRANPKVLEELMGEVLDDK